MHHRLYNRYGVGIVAGLALAALTGASPASLKVGDPAPTFSLPTLEGPKLDLKDEIGHQPVLLTFFKAVGPSGWVQNKDFRAAVDVESTFPSYVRVITIAVGNQKPEFDQLRYPGDIDTTVLLAPGLADPAVKAYGITETPASFLVNKDGTLAGVYLKYKELQPAVADLLETAWQDQAFVFKDSGPAPDVSFDGDPEFKNLKNAPKKPTLYLFWAAASHPSESALTALNAVVGANPEFAYVAATFSPSKLVGQRVNADKLGNLRRVHYSSKANGSLFGKGDPIFPLWVIVNTNGNVLYRGVGPLTSDEIRDLLAKTRAFLRGT